MVKMSKIDQCSVEVQNIFSRMPLSLISTQRKANIAYCHRCRGVVSFMKDEMGNKRCAGNMLTNAGCGNII